MVSVDSIFLCCKGQYSHYCPTIIVSQPFYFTHKKIDAERQTNFFKFIWFAIFRSRMKNVCFLQIPKHLKKMYDYRSRKRYVDVEELVPFSAALTFESVAALTFESVAGVLAFSSFFLMLLKYTMAKFNSVVDNLDFFLFFLIFCQYFFY